MCQDKETFKVTDSKGFHYSIDLEHSPHLGFSTAYFRGSIIGQVELGRILPPTGDDDREWEAYQDLFGEWTDEIKTNMAIICKDFFDKN